MLIASLACLGVLLMLPSVAAACSRVERADSIAASRTVSLLRRSGNPGAVDAAGVLARASRSCADLRFARAVAQSWRLGAPAEGQRRRVLGVDLVGARTASTVVWRLDVVRLAGRVAVAPNEGSATALRRTLLAAGSGAAARVWSDDPTRQSWDPARQSAVAVALARSARPAERRLAGASVRAFATRGRLIQLGRLPLLEHLMASNRLALAAARSGQTAPNVIARAIGQRTLVRVRGARSRAWSRIDGRWTSAAQHRSLVVGAAALAGRIATPANLKLARELRGTLTDPAAVDFGSLPVDAFYPWPRDTAFDSQAVSVDIDKPATLELAVYGPDERVVRTVTLAVDPGVTSLTWDGSDATGVTLGAGDYRYAITATDPVGNAVRVPGLEQFRIARDTAAPAVRRATVRAVTSGGVRRLVASWDVAEVHSPQVRSWLLLQNGATRRSIQLHGTLRTASVRRVLAADTPPGTWRASFVFIDGSGNRTAHAAGNLVVR